MTKHDIFISYSRRDGSVVNHIVDILRKYGYSVWIDVNGIESGEAFRGIIVDAIESSEIFLFFSSEDSNKSIWTTKEISLAVDSKKYIIPIKLDKTRYNKNIRFDLIDLDYIDFSEEKLFEASLNKLLRTIKNKIGERSVPDINPKVSVFSEVTSKPTSRNQYQFEHKNFKKCLKTFRRLRNNIINVILSSFVMVSLIALFLGVSYWPAAFTGLYGSYLLLINREDGFAFVAASSLLWTLSIAYHTAPDFEYFRFFHQGNILIAWAPLTIAAIAPFMLLIKKNGFAWWQQCKKISVLGIITLTITAIFWLWTIYFDFVTKFGLPPNIRYYINKLLTETT